ncbi:MAG: NUDIX domain-containing protein [Candidatus Pacebacteria bacterium]|nr:NUDIX domain-containing protein [Candidatus Paceibacterota bacterium]
MELLKEIKDADWPKDLHTLQNREAARGVFFDDQEKVALLFISAHKYHKLPGGGIDAGENKEEALKRELLEEVGSDIEIDGYLGTIIEFRSHYDLKQTSHCYYGKVLSKGEPSFTQKELGNGFQIVWMKLEDAISTLQNDQPESYPGRFIQERDLEILKRVQEKTA